jgi:hypothetical protein
MHALAVVVGVRHDDDLVAALEKALRERPDVHFNALVVCCVAEPREGK